MNRTPLLLRAPALRSLASLSCRGLALGLTLLGLLAGSPAARAAQTDLPAPADSGTSYAATVVVLPNGNIVVVDTSYSASGATNAGAVYLLNGADLSVISTLTGTAASDQVGSGGITVLSNGNFVVGSSSWTGSRGAVTWGSATTGFIGGPTVAVSATNSLVGSTANDNVGSSGVTPLSNNGNYVVASARWDNGAVTDVGAVTWGDGTGGTVGAVSAANSLVGSTGSDQVGGTTITALTNGNYVVRSQSWDNGPVANAGAVTWGNGTGGTVGAVSAANSLVGSTLNDNVGLGVTGLTNGHYVVRSQSWDNGLVADAGAVTWGNGSTVGPRLVGAVTAANSLVGSTANNTVGSSGVTALTNGNYVVASARWDNGALTDVGAVTWGDGTGGTVGAVSAANSLVGSTTIDLVGQDSVTALTNDHYVVASSAWNNGLVANAGAVTWGNGTGGTVGAVSATNSLVGSATADRVGNQGITALTNGHYVFRSPNWDNGLVPDAGAVSWGNGTGGTVGPVSAANSLVGSTGSDQVGGRDITALTNGHYVVASPNWANGALTNVGAVTWGNGTGGTVGAVSAANSLVGSTADDLVGNLGVTALTNGHYVVRTQFWNNGAVTQAGAVTWGNGSTVGPRVVGAVSAANSLVGSTANDQVGQFGVTVLTNGNYVVGSAFWDNGTVADAGAVTWGNGSAGTVGAVSATNSLVGSTANDNVGRSGVAALTNGRYMVASNFWNNGAVASAGAVTLGNATGSTVGTVSAANSVLGTVGSGVGTAAYDSVRDRLFVGRNSSKILSVFSSVVATAPGAPTSVSATAGNAQATVAFTAPGSNGGSAITSYTVTSSPGGLTATGASSPITVTGLTNGTSYTFTVTATNAVGSSVASTASAAVTPATVPGAPTIGTTTADNTQASVAFTAPASNGGAAITGYTATSSPGNFTATGASSPLTVIGLTNGTVYTFTLTATNAVGTGAASVASNAVTPKAPQTITFANPGNRNFGTTPTFTATASSGLAPTFSTTTPTVLSITSGGAVTFLTPGSATVVANQAGSAAFNAASAVSQTFFVDAVVPGAPTIGAATPGNAQASVAFSAPAFTGGSAITGYTVTSSPGGLTATGTTSPLTVIGLTNGTSYTFTVKATSGLGTGAASTASSAVTPATVPGAPTAATGTGGNTQVSVAFTAPASNGGSAITGYTVTSSPGNVTATGATSPLIVTGLTNGTAYTFTVTATNGIGTGAASTASSAVTPATVPGAPTAAIATPGNAQVSVAFTAPASNGGAAITGYTVTSSPGNVTATGATSPLIVPGLTNGTSYTFTVKATNAIGAGAASTASAAVTPATLPGAPTAVNAVMGNGQSVVSFTAPAITGGAAITGYTVTSSPGNFTGTGASAPITVTGLTNGTSYSFTVTATNATGTGTASGASPGVTSALTAAGGYRTAFAYTLTGSGTPTSYAATGLPTGLIVSPTTGAISGAPTQTGAFNAALTVTNAAGSGTYTLVLTVAKAALTVTGATAANKVYDAALTATPVTTGAALVGVFTGDTVTLTTTGVTGLFATKQIGTGKTVQLAGLVLGGADAANYTLTQPAPTADITAKALTVTGVTATGKIYDGNTVVSLTTAGAALAGVVSGDTVTLTATGATGAFASAGVGSAKPVTITGLAISGADAGNYTLTPPAGLTANITVASATIAFSGLTPTFDGTPKSAAVTTAPAGLGVTLTYDGGSTAPTNAGIYAVAAAIADANYTGSAAGTLTIAAATQSVTFPAPGGTLAIGTPITLGATASSGLPVTYALVSGPATLAGSTLTLTSSGAVVVRATQAGNANLAAASADLALASVLKLAQTISFAALPDKRANDPAFTLSATASSGLPVSFAVASGPALLSGTALTLTGAPGEVLVRASQPGNAAYDAAPDAVRSLTVIPVGPLVFFGKLGGGTSPGGDFAAQIAQDGKSGTMIGIIPGTGEGFVVTFTIDAAGNFVVTTQTFTGNSTGAAATETGRVAADAIDNGTPIPTTAASGATRIFRGNVTGGLLTGSIDGLATTFNATLVPATGPTVNTAGYYRSASLQTATGAIYSILGTTGQVYVLAITPGYVGGNLGTANADGTFTVQAAGATTIRGAINAPTTTVTGTLSRPSVPPESFAGLAVTTIRTDRLINLSTRARVVEGQRQLIAGFVIGGTADKTVLVRAVGPSLTQFGLPGALASARLRLFDGGGRLLREVDGWRVDPAVAAATSRVGAFALTDGDSALLTALAPGAYTIHVVATPVPGGATPSGLALAEIYDASVNPQAEYQRLVNISSRGSVTAGEGVLIGGFIITGNSPKRVLVRATGPALATYGLSGVLADPQVAVYGGTTLLARNDNWETAVTVNTAQVAGTAAEIAAAATQVGAFALPVGSRDASVILTLAPGAYTAQISGVANGTGVALIEIYEIP